MIVFAVIHRFRLLIENIIVEHVGKHSVRSARRNKVQYMNSVLKKKFESVFHATIESKRQFIKIQFSLKIGFFVSELVVSVLKRHLKQDPWKRAKLNRKRKMLYN